MPLIRSLSELVDGLEPHDHVLLPRTAVVLTYWYQGAGRVYPGWRARWVPGRGIPGMYPAWPD